MANEKLELEVEQQGDGTWRAVLRGVVATGEGSTPAAALQAVAEAFAGNRPAPAVQVQRVVGAAVRPMFTPAEAAQLLGGISVRQVQRLARAKKVPGAVYLGSALRFRADELEAFVAAQRGGR